MRLKVTEKVKSISQILKELVNRVLKSAKKVKNIELIVVGTICVVLLTFASVRYVNNNKLLKMLSDMYYLDLVEAKERYLLLEVETNPFISLDRDSDSLEIAVLHLKSGEIYNVTVDTEKSVFTVDNGTNKMINNKVFKYNKTLETKLRKNKKDENMNVLLDLEK